MAHCRPGPHGEVSQWAPRDGPWVGRFHDEEEKKEGGKYPSVPLLIQPPHSFQNVKETHGIKKKREKEKKRKKIAVKKTIILRVQRVVRGFKKRTRTF